MRGASANCAPWRIAARRSGSPHAWPRRSALGPDLHGAHAFMLAFHLGTAAALGLASSLHCIGMCGPLAAGVCSIPRASRGARAPETTSSSSRQASSAGHASGASALEYLGGRVAGYAAAGAVAGALTQPFALGTASGYARVGAGVIVGLSLARTAIRWLRPLDRERLVPLRKRRDSKADVVLAALLRLVPRGSWSLGLATALFPCGTLLGGLLAAAASGSPSTGAAMMVVFALASSPALLATILLGDRLSRRLAAKGGPARRVFAVAMLVFAGWAIAAPLGALARSNEPASCHAP